MSQTYGQVSFKNLQTRQIIRTFSDVVAAEDKLKDKLAIAARDKLAATNKEKLIQAERKRKAAMFAAMLKSNQQDQQLQQQTANQRAQAAAEASGQDLAAGLQPSVPSSTPLKGENARVLSWLTETYAVWIMPAVQRPERKISTQTPLKCGLYLPRFDC